MQEKSKNVIHFIFGNLLQHILSLLEFETLLMCFSAQIDGITNKLKLLTLMGKVTLIKIGSVSRIILRIIISNYNISKYNSFNLCKSYVVRFYLVYISNH